MNYSIFPQTKNNQLQEPMFFGQPVNVSRYDQQKYPIFEGLIEKQLSFFWRPEEIDVSQDRKQFNDLPEHQQHIFVSNLKYQTLLDSIQGRSPNAVLLPIVSLPELETWIETWSFSETIHSRSYTHIIRNIFTDPSVVFDDIMDNKHILARAKDIAKYYDDLYETSQKYLMTGEGDLRELKKKLYLCLMAINALEGIRFYVSFACSFTFAENKVMEGNAKIIKMIARDESLHLNGTQSILSILQSGSEGDEWVDISEELKLYSISIFSQVVKQEKEWADYLFSKGSMLGLNKDILYAYVEYIANIRMSAVGLRPIFETKSNPISWINAWLSSDNVQVAPQETEITSYLVGQVDSNLDDLDLNEFSI